MSDENNPDVAEVIARNRETCTHPEDKLVDDWEPRGSGIPGMIGCHNVAVIRCTSCRQVVDMGSLHERQKLRELIASLEGKFTPEGTP